VTRRRNADRTGPPPPEDTGSPPPAQTGDLFSFVCPTEFVELPSGGQLYSSDHPLHNVSTVEIKHMTAKEEDILTSETLLKRGMAIDRLIESVLVDKTIKIDELLVGDKNAILLATRITGFGSDYLANVTCPSCVAKVEHEFDLSDVQNKKISLDGVRSTANGVYLFELPTTKIALEIKLLTSSDERTISQNNDRRKKLKLPENNTTTLLAAIMVSANGVTDSAQLLQLAELLPVRDSMFIRKTYDALRPDVDMEHAFSCSSCGYEGGIVMPLTAEFFWPNQ